MTAAGVTTRYELDNGRVLSANAAGNVTYYLYGLGPIGELTTDWNYSLPDGAGSPRQLTDADGAVTLTSSYTPWGDTLETHGSGNFTQGYFGGIMDSATGLIYVGNGQYYDPATGRFLTRDARPSQNNPYTPIDPTGAMLAPLALLALVYGRRKSRGKWDMLVILLVMCLAVGMSLSACKLPAPVPSPTPTGTPTQPPATGTPTPGNNPGSSPTTEHKSSVSPSPTCTGTPTPTPSPTPSSIDEELKSIYHVAISDDFPETYKTYVLEAVKKVAGRFASVMGWEQTTAFSRVYGVGYLFNWGECDNCGDAFAYTSHDHIDFRKFFSAPGQNPKFIIHELGHAFDHKVCAISNGGNPCNVIYDESIIRANLKKDVATMPFLNRNGYGSRDDQPPFSGFAGGKDDWQFTSSGQVSFSMYQGEVWADMFLGWNYGNLAEKRLNYMNGEMPKYLNLFN